MTRKHLKGFFGKALPIELEASFILNMSSVDLKRGIQASEVFSSLSIR